MRLQRSGRELDVVYQVDQRYFVYWVDIIVDGEKTWSTKQYVLPLELHALKWMIDEVPVAFDGTDLPRLTLYWGGPALRQSVKERIDLEPLLLMIDRCYGDSNEPF